MAYLDLAARIFNAFRTPHETPFLAGGIALVKTLPIGVAALMAFGLLPSDDEWLLRCTHSADEAAAERSPDPRI